ncbi:MAG TPA: hypothetical protein PL029_10425, partial [Bacteroidia bacterium]|nr:hypothetical protein [Bacteroidia bacterium]
MIAMALIIPTYAGMVHSYVFFFYLVLASEIFKTLFNAFLFRKPSALVLNFRALFVFLGGTKFYFLIVLVSFFQSRIDLYLLGFVFDQEKPGGHVVAVEKEFGAFRFEPGKIRHQAGPFSHEDFHGDGGVGQEQQAGFREPAQEVFRQIVHGMRAGKIDAFNGGGRRVPMSREGTMGRSGDVVRHRGG